MRCVSVCVRGQWLRLPCGGPAASVRSLGSEALRRYRQAEEAEDGDGDRKFSMLRCGGGELLHPEDLAEEVLGDNDFVQLGWLFRLRNLSLWVIQTHFLSIVRLCFVCVL